MVLNKNGVFPCFQGQWLLLSTQLESFIVYIYTHYAN